MLLYSQDAARDFLYPINRNKITDLYKETIEDISRTYWAANQFGPKFPNRVTADNKIYGEMIGIHILHNKEGLLVRIPTLFTTIPITTYIDILAQSNQLMPVHLLHHKGKHIAKIPNRYTEEFHFGMISMVMASLLETIVIKRMCIKLGSIKPYKYSYKFPFLIPPRFM